MVADRWVESIGHVQKNKQLMLKSLSMTTSLNEQADGMTIAQEALRHSPDNNISPTQNYVVVEYLQIK